jgi:hypothetical protein
MGVTIYKFLVIELFGLKMKKLKYFSAKNENYIIIYQLIYKMNAYREFCQAQQLLIELFAMADSLDQQNINDIKNELNFHINQMLTANNPLPIVQPVQPNHNHIQPQVNHIQPHQNLDEIVVIRPITRSRRIVPNANIQKSKVISKKKLQESCPHECAICQETPKYKDALCTDCSHYYCKTCWQDWMNAPGSSKNCPICRNNAPRITIYKERAMRQRQLVIEL